MIGIHQVNDEQAIAALGGVQDARRPVRRGHTHLYAGRLARQGDVCAFQGVPGVGDINHAYVAANPIGDEDGVAGHSQVPGITGGVEHAHECRVSWIGHVDGCQAGRTGGDVGNRTGDGHGACQAGHRV